MSNLQIENMLLGIQDLHQRAHYKLLDESISRLYVNGFINRSAMQKARQKLVNEVARPTHWQPLPLPPTNNK